MQENHGNATGGTSRHVGELILLGVIILVTALALLETREYSPLGSIFPIVIGSVLLLFCALAFLRSIRGKSRAVRGIGLASLPRVVVFIAIMVGWIAMLETAGFLLSGVVCFVLILLAANRDRLSLARVLAYLVAAVVMVFAFDYIFVDLLKVTLPRGTLF